MKQGKASPWRWHKALKENTEQEAARTADVQEQVIKPLQEKRELFENDHLAEIAARSLGIIR